MTLGLPYALDQLTRLENKKGETTKEFDNIKPDNDPIFFTPWRSINKGGNFNSRLTNICQKKNKKAVPVRKPPFESTHQSESLFLNPT